MSAVPDLRARIAERCSFPEPSGAFRKDDLNRVLYVLDGDYLDAPEVYAYDAPPKREFYKRVGAECGFDYQPGDGNNARPLNLDELEQVLRAVEDAR